MRTSEAESPDTVRLESGRDWCGYLTLGNCEAVAARLKRLLAGRTFTFVKVNEGQRRWCPEVNTGECLTGTGVEASVLGDGTRAVYIHHGGWMGCLYTNVPDGDTAQQRNREAGAGEEAARGEWLHDKKLTYLSIKRDRVVIEHYAPGGNRLYWVIVVDDQDVSGG